MTDAIPQARDVDRIRRQIGQNVKAELIRLGLGQEKVADLLGISQPQVSKRIAGSIGFEAAELVKIAEGLGIPVARLVEIAPAPVGAP